MSSAGAVETARERSARLAALLSVVLFAFTAAAALAWLAWRAPDVAYFSHVAPAEWIVEARPASTRLRPAAEREVIFARSFALVDPPAHVRLRVRIHRSGAVRLNGADVVLSPVGASWKSIREGDVAALLRAGENRLEVRAAARSAPAALWLALDGPGLTLGSDASWSAGERGTALRPARLATTPMDEWNHPRATGALALLEEAMPWVAAFTLASALVSALAFRARPLEPLWLLGAAALALAFAWLRNRELPPPYGFDAHFHLEYVRFLLAEHRLPLATDGWSMYHPPLYYSAAAVIFALIGGESVAALRALNALGVLVQCAALLGSLRLLFADRPRAVASGLAIGAFLPMQLYLAQFVTNEIWAAALASCALWLCLRCGARDDRSLRAHLALGALLGAALLTKLSTLLVAAAIVAIVAARLIARGERAPHAWLSSLGATILALTAIAGWHYARVAWVFGSPFVGNWDAASGFLWWQDPGYRTAWDYLRFGQSLRWPILAAAHSCPDALYSTLWGDALIGGRSSLQHGPPWHYPLLFAGEWLGILPSAAVGLGGAVLLARFLRAPSLDLALLLGVAASNVFALVALSLRLPYYAQCKAFYALPALVPFAAFAGVGFDLAATRLGRAGGAVWVLLGAFTLCTVATYTLRWTPG